MEDNSANQKVAKFLLSKYGPSVEVAHNGREAVEHVRREDFDLVLMDVQMPVMDGFQATAAIRKLEDPRKAAIPIIAMTAHAMKGDEERCLAAGMDDYVAKPIDHRKLFEIIHRLAGAAATPVKAKPRPATASSEGVFHLDRAVTILDGRYELFQGDGGLFLPRFGRNARQFAGQPAKLRCATRCRGAAHRIKGTVLYLGADRAAEAASRLEDLGNSGNLRGAAEAVRRLEEELTLLSQALATHRPAQ